MFCERCGSALTASKVVCPSCGALLSKSQIEILKEIKKDNKIKSRPQYLSEMFGVKRDIIFRDKNKSNSSYIIIFILFLLFFINFIVILMML